ncbi:MFS transporter [Brooklawnia cerclae]|uniref:MFS family permease n=1 Tax=Brooklawnia cerclae TaxID=349934 RepID=A0ABX0SIT7_9ACTN|nr:MFS transporter [Brooklawnia cerclae]NIH57886.1 MFS family permease [Brooklawnia cerclae]
MGTDAYATRPADAVNDGGGSAPRQSILPRAHAISWLTLLVTTLAILMTAVDGGILPAVLPAIKDEFGLNDAQAGLINSVFFAGLIVGAVLFGWIADRIGSGYMRTWTWIIAMALGTIGGLLTWGFSGAFASFLLLRIPMGISRGGSEPVNVALVGEWWPREYRGFAVGVHHTGFPLGQFATGALIALVLGVGGWREAFLVIPLIGVPIMIAQAFIGTKKHQQTVYDWIDANGLTCPTHELSVRSPGNLIAPVKQVLKSGNARWCVMLVFLFLWAETGATTFLTSQLTERGVSLTDAALVSGASGLTGWIGQVGWGWASDRTGRKFALRFLTVGWAVAVIAMLGINSMTTAWVILILWGLVRNAPFPVVYALLIDSLPRSAGTAMGLMIGIAVGVSGVIAAPVQGAIIDHFGYPVHYIVLTFICLLGLLPLAKIRETVPEDHVWHEAEIDDAVM